MTVHDRPYKSLEGEDEIEEQGRNANVFGVGRFKEGLSKSFDSEGVNVDRDFFCFDLDDELTHLKFGCRQLKWLRIEGTVCAAEV